MNQALLNLPAAFGLGVAAGLNASLPLALVSLMARAGWITLSPPFDALASDLAVGGLLLLAVFELAMDKIPGLDSVGHFLLFPLSVAAGAILFASESGAVSSVHPGLTVVIGILVGGATAGTVHTVRATLRPVMHVVPGLGPIASIAEDATAVLLSGAALFAPPLVPVILLVGAVLLVLLTRVLLKVGGNLLRRSHEWIRQLFGGGGGQLPPLDGGSGLLEEDPGERRGRRARSPEVDVDDLLGEEVAASPRRSGRTSRPDRRDGWGGSADDLLSV